MRTTRSHRRSSFVFPILGKPLKSRGLVAYNDASNIRLSPSHRNQLAASACRLHAVSAFTPALRIDGQSLPQGACYLRSLRREGIAPSIEPAVVKGELAALPCLPSLWISHISEERTTRVTYAYKGQGQKHNDPYSSPCYTSQELELPISRWKIVRFTLLLMRKGRKLFRSGLRKKVSWIS